MTRHKLHLRNIVSGLAHNHMRGMRGLAESFGANETNPPQAGLQLRSLPSSCRYLLRKSSKKPIILTLETSTLLLLIPI